MFSLLSVVDRKDNFQRNQSSCLEGPLKRKHGVAVNRLSTCIFLTKRTVYLVCNKNVYSENCTGKCNFY